MGSGKKVLHEIRKSDSRKSSPKVLEWDDIVSLLLFLGYVMKEARGGGSAVRFFHPKTQHIIFLHRPHPGTEICPGARAYILKSLKTTGVLQ